MLLAFFSPASRELLRQIFQKRPGFYITNGLIHHAWLNDEFLIFKFSKTKAKNPLVSILESAVSDLKKKKSIVFIFKIDKIKGRGKKQHLPVIFPYQRHQSLQTGWMRIRVHSVCIHTNMCESLSFCYDRGSAGREGNCRKGAMTLNSNVPAFMSRTTVNRAWGKYPQITSHEFIHNSNQKTFPAPLLPSSPVLLTVV